MAKETAIPDAAKTASGTLGINLSRLNYLDGFLQKLVDDERHAFVAFRALRRGVLIFDGYYGVSAPGGGALTSDGIHPMQSITKTLVATSCAILQELGLIDFWDPVSKYFPEFDTEEKRSVSLWHLLCHSSGMSEEQQDSFVDELLEKELGLSLTDDMGDDARLDAYMQARETAGLPDMARSWDAAQDMFFRLSLRTPLARAPETAFEYCNTAYAMLGDIIERISGKTLEQFLTENIFTPLGMSDSHFILPESKHARFVTRDASYRSGEYLSSESILSSTSAAGGLKSTIRDLTRFALMFQQGGTVDGTRIISPASVSLMTTDHNAELPPSFWRERLLGSNWGLGWDVKNGKKDDLGMLRSERSYNHGGFGGARLHVDPDAELVVALYMVEQFDELSCDDQSNAMNVLYSALD